VRLRRRRKGSYVGAAEEALREVGWRRVPGDGANSVWASSTGLTWLPFESALREAARRLPPDRELQP
jgi:hypothetical protein